MLTIIVAIVLFILAWWLISMVPLPATMPAATRTVLYCLLILVVIVWVWHTYAR